MEQVEYRERPSIQTSLALDHRPPLIICAFWGETMFGLPRSNLSKLWRGILVQVKRPRANSQAHSSSLCVIFGFHCVSHRVKNNRERLDIRGARAYNIHGLSHVHHHERYARHQSMAGRPPARCLQSLIPQEKSPGTRKRSLRRRFAF